MRNLVLLLSSAALFGCRCGGDPEGDPRALTGTWRLAWQDEFDGPAGQPPDPSRWGHDVGGSGWGNQQLEFDTDLAQNASLDGQGRLAIVARAESYGGRQHTSARINTAGRFTQAHGRFEARIKLPPGRGLWPAFWLLGDNFSSTGWPGCGEIDVMEYRGQNPGIIIGSLHGPGYSGGAAVTTTHALPGGATYDADFHVFSVEWSSSRIDYRVDDTVYQTVTPGQLPAGAPWVFDHPFFIILNLAVGGTFVGPPDSTTPFPATLLVDYVRVYELAQ